MRFWVLASALFLCSYTIVLQGMKCVDTFHWYSPIPHLAVTTMGLCYKLFSVDTLKVAGISLPLYALARLLDEPIQKNFFCHETKKNINQYPNVYHIIHEGFIATTVGVGIYSFLKGLQSDISWYADSIGCITCILSVWGFKNILKLSKHEGCLRPFHEKYAPIKRSYGGCPSGHMAMIASMTSYWWERRGPILGIPFACLAVGASFSLINVNRHYISQVVAGCALGIVMGLAGAKAVDFLKNVCEDVRCGASYNAKTKTASVSFECSF